MANKEVLDNLRDDDKQELQKQLGCMNGIFQLFDRRYLLGQRRHGHHQKRPSSAGQSDNGEKELRNDKEKASTVVMKEKNRVSIELPRNSFSSCSSSTAISSLDCSKRVQTEFSSSCQSVASEPSSSPFPHRKQPNLFMQSPDIRDVVKDSMTREPRVVSIKTVSKDERVGPAMKHIDSPRPYPHQKPVQHDGSYRNLVKLRESPWGVEKLKENSRFSCDGRESRYLQKSNMKIKELPRLSLDSRQGYINNSANDPISNKRPSSSVVARLMGLEALTATIDDNQTLKTESEELVSNSRSSRKKEELKQDRSFVSPRVQKNLVSPQRGVRVSHVITRIPLETAPWKQERSGRAQQKLPFKSKEYPAKASCSIYHEIEKRLTEHEFKPAGKDLRALKQILEAMQKTKSRLGNKEHALDTNSINDGQSQKTDQPISPTINGISPRKVKPADARKNSVGRNRLKEPSVRDKKANGRPLSTSNFPEQPGTVSPKLHRSRNGIHGSSPDMSRPKKQLSIHRTPMGSTNRNPKAKSMEPQQDSSETRYLSQQSDTVSFQSENESEVTSTEWVQEVNSPFRPKETHRINIAERLIDEKSIFDHAKHTIEQPSPVSVLDAFYTEDTPSPVKKKSISFNDDENLQFEEEKDQSRMNNLVTSTNLDQYSQFNNVKLENIKNLVHQIELLNTNNDAAADDDATVNHTPKSPCEGDTGDHRYVAEILLTSGCLKDLDRTATIIQLNPTGGLINPELFHVLEKAKTSTELTDDRHHKNNTRSKIRRKLVFDTVNDVLGQKLSMFGPFGPHKGSILNGDKLLKEVCSGIDSLQNNSERNAYDEDDEVVNIMNADVNKRSQDWNEYCHQVPGLVLDIERLIFKDLISEVVNPQITGLKDFPHGRRQLFPM